MLQKIFATGALLLTSALSFSQIAAVTPTVTQELIIAEPAAEEKNHQQLLPALPMYITDTILINRLEI